MHDIWNPWHGYHKCSEGCQYCYMYTMDQKNGRSGAEIYRTKTGFYYPLQKDRRGQYKIRSGEMLRVCMTSDFFLTEADPWRDEAWDMIRMRPDVIFFLLTKRPQRVSACLPEDWGNGWENVFFHVACENQIRANVPIVLSHHPFSAFLYRMCIHHGRQLSVLFVHLSDHVRFVGIPRSFFAAKDGLYGAFLSGGQSPGKQARRHHRCHMATQNSSPYPI
ncbi:DUF5131 family protein [Evtepia gabavorous]|uniref:DUF5131 family protein n=1 Tax=Evtepia gabavorous TaxID=2211183 RepID=UPI003A94CC22